MKWRKRSISLAMALTMLCGCGASEQAFDPQALNQYQPETDYEYTTEGFYGQRVQYGNGGFYAYTDRHGFVYFIDAETGAAAPVCSKLDCMHDQEVNEERRKGCNAYINGEIGFSSNNIYYYNGDIYYCNEDPTNRGITLYRLAGDGSSRERVFDLGLDCVLQTQMIHRGRFYYIKKQYILEKDGTIREEEYFNYIPLNGMAKEHTICRIDLEYITSSWGVMKAYGDQIFLPMDGYRLDENGNAEETREQWLMTYQISSDIFSELALEGLEENAQVLYAYLGPEKYYLKDQNSNEISNWYQVDYEDQKVEKVPVEIPDGYSIYGSDSSYIYVHNALRAAVGLIPKEEQEYRVYDLDWNLIDTFTVEDNVPLAPCMPNAGCYVMLENNSSEEDSTVTYTIKTWDKSKIGAYQGGSIELTEILRVETEPE